MPPTVTWAQALTWRLGRHHLLPPDATDAAEVVRDLCGVQAQVPSSAEAAIGVRRADHVPDEVDRALADGTLIRTWAMRGTLHLLAPDAAAPFLALMASGRSWERASWQRYFGVGPREIDQLRDIVRGALAGRALTREELIAAVVARPGTQHLGDALRSGWGTLLKPLAWQGELCHGPMRGRNVTFQSPRDVASTWPGIPGPSEAAPVAIAAYLRAYGPATLAAFSGWLAGGWFGTRQLHAWAAGLSDRLAEVDVEGERLLVLSDDLEDLVATKPTRSIRLLPGFDQWVLGPGTAATSVVPAGRRRDVSRQSGWIAPVVLRGGVVVGTWGLDGGVARVAWFTEAGAVPRSSVFADEVARWSVLAGRPLDLAIAAA